MSKNTKKQNSQAANEVTSAAPIANPLPQAFLDKLAEYGISAPPELIASDSFMRWGENSRYYAIAKGDGYCFGDWPSDTKGTWFPGDLSTLTATEKRNRRAAIAAAQQEVEKLRRGLQTQAAKDAQEQWEGLSATGSSVYLKRKKVEAHGIRYKGKNIVIPVRDADGAITSLQFIDADSQKCFLPDGRIKGCFHALGELKNGGWIGVAEGYATAASCHEAAGIPIVAAFFADNLLPVVTALQKRFPASNILILGDDDRWPDKNGNPKSNTGQIKAMGAASHCGCHMVLPVFSETSLTGKPTDFNDVHVMEGLDTLKIQLEIAMQQAPVSRVPTGFKIDADGVHCFEKEGTMTLCQPPLHIVAYTLDEDDNNHGRLLVWTSTNSGKEHRWALPFDMLAGDMTEIYSRLLHEGMIFDLSHRAKQRFAEYLQGVQPGKTLMSISRPGWHGESFALPDVVYPNDGDKVLQTSNLHFSTFKVKGTLEEWQQNIARYAKDNSRLAFALCVAFAAPLLEVSDEESGAVHLVGGSSIGKTTAMRIAGSVWGGGSDNGFIKQWRATANALEAIAESHRDCMLPLDELSQTDPKTVGDAVYMLANNQGKSRMRSSATLRPSYEWRVLVLSSGEVTLEEKMSEAGQGRKLLAGMAVRFVSVPADAGQGKGIANTWHEFSTGDAFARHLKEACGKYYGTAIRAYLTHLVTGNNADKEKVAKYIQDVRLRFNQKHLPEVADGQVHRVAGRFGLIAAAGELAISYGILPLAAGEALDAVAVCFKAWLDIRGGTGPMEVELGINRLREYLEKYGASRFPLMERGRLLSKASKVQDNDHPVTDEKVHERMGFRENIEGRVHFYLRPAQFTQICGGSAANIAREMGKRGLLQRDNSGKTQINKRLPEMGAARVYHILPTLLGDGVEDASDDPDLEGMVIPSEEEFFAELAERKKEQ